MPGFRSLLAFLLLGLWPVGGAMGQSEERSAAELIRHLTYESPERPGKLLLEMGLFDCGSGMAEEREDRQIADSLVRLGLAAIPDLTAAIDSIETQGQMNAAWILYAYARIEGAAASPRLRRMLDDPRLAYLQGGLESAIAASLGLTAYVDSSPEIPERVFSCEGQKPEDALDRFILAWEKDDSRVLETSLGPRAKAALDELLKEKSWDAMRAELWRGAAAGDVAMGYRMDGPGFAPEAVLKNRSGGDCGKRPVVFFRTGDAFRNGGYLIDNSDLGDLLRAVAACAAQR